MICLDTSVLIDFFRKKDKSKSFFYGLAASYDEFAVSSVTEFEIYIGSNPDSDQFWDEFFQNVVSLPFDSLANKEAIEIDRQLKKISKQIDIPDLMIAACAISNGLKLATLNSKHFSRISQLEIITE
ncbi:MAG: type II toxin-antitoxin system VapC family toxin [Tangfeifania sp.]